MKYFLLNLLKPLLVLMATLKGIAHVLSTRTPYKTLYVDNTKVFIGLAENYREDGINKARIIKVYYKDSGMWARYGIDPKQIKPGTVLTEVTKTSDFKA